MCKNLGKKNIFLLNNINIFFVKKIGQHGHMDNTI